MKFAIQLYLKIYDVTKKNKEIQNKKYLKENQQLVVKPNMRIILSEKHNSDYYLFQPIYNDKQDLLIQKVGNSIYFIKREINQFMIVGKPIFCGTDENFGAATGDGEFLVVWDTLTSEFRVYKIIQEM